jgi:hypothetical protein
MAVLNSSLEGIDSSNPQNKLSSSSKIFKASSTFSELI